MQHAAPSIIQEQAVPDHSGLLRQTLIDVLAEGWKQVCVLGVEDIDGQIEVEA